MMISYSCSAFSLSKIQVYLKKLFPSPSQQPPQIFQWFVDTTFVDQIAGSGGLARIRTSDDDIDMSLFFSHVSFALEVIFTTLCSHSKPVAKTGCEPFVN